MDAQGRIIIDHEKIAMKHEKTPKKIVWARVLLTAGFLLLLIGTPAESRRKIIERIIVRVNSEIITLTQYNEQEQRLKAQLAKESDPRRAEQQFQEMKKDLLKDLIDESLLTQKAKDLDISVDSQIVKYFDQLRAEMKLETIEDLQEEAEKQGLSWEDFRERIARQFLTREVIWREVRSRIIISREDVRKYYEEHKEEYNREEEAHLRQIMIDFKDREPGEAEKVAEEVLKRIEGEEDFSKLAREYSDHATARSGGDTGWFGRGTMSPEFEKLAFELPEGETSGILRTDSDLRILKVEGRHQAGIASFEEMEPNITEMLYSKEMNPALREFLTRLRKESHIRIAQGYEDTGAAPEEPPLRAGRKRR